MDFPPIHVPGSGQLYARLKTSLGDIIIRLEELRAPKTVKNFVGLATGSIDWKDPKTGKSMFGTPLYDGVRFHRVIPRFMIQCGDPLSRHPEEAARWGSGGPGYKFSDEFHPELKHDSEGILSMANSGQNANGSQWFITGESTPHLDNKHSVFGRVIGGMDVVNRIATEPTNRDRPIKDIFLERVEIFRSEHQYDSPK
ncbi:peptidylprolyl isomerase [Stigmatella sp. ncwal1]|uniref:Peptidyl-prolyl cis-trans isomerase n=1 Tax=Stigmatella ashevillensis TaxID=2995309 RepID=A0ABT5D280_9BACT|nr:peptidylprolyl isomerase [Stigmatella ashevillena]MDC0707764.1 peptidylprolyl isomerase [Stigmatella ashevillena]